MSDITLVIDADTARYIANIAKAAEANKGLAKPVKEHNELWEAGVEVLGRNVMKMTAIGAGIEMVKTVAEAVTEQYDHWLERLKEAQKTLTDIARTGNGPLGGTPQGPGAARGALMAMDSQLSNEQRFAAYGAYRSAHPGASTEQGVAAVEAASQAEIGGLNPNDFAGGLGKLRGLGNDAKDVTALALGKGGGQGGAIIDLIAEITAKSGAAQAKAALPLALSASQTTGGLDVLKQGYSAFSNQGRQGSFADTFRDNGLSLVPGLGTRATLAAINAGARTNQVGPGYFGAIVGAGEGDAVNQADSTVRAYGVRKQNREYSENIQAALHRQADELFNDYYGKKQLFNTPLVNSVLRAGHFYDDSGDEGTADAAKTAHNLDDIADKLVGAIEKQTQDQRAPAVGDDAYGGD